MPEIRHFFPPASPAASPGEISETLFKKGATRIERIISRSAPSPEGFWYDQDEDEWVLLVQGAATLRFEPDQSLELKAGDHLLIPAHQRHRVDWTSDEALWLAVHVG